MPLARLIAPRSPGSGRAPALAVCYRARAPIATQNLDALQRTTHEAVVDGRGRVEPSIRRQVARGQPPPELAALVRKIHDDAYRVTDADITRCAPRATKISCPS